jgi:hypothetical protein
VLSRSHDEQPIVGLNEESASEIVKVGLLNAGRDASDIARYGKCFVIVIGPAVKSGRVTSLICRRVTLSS